MKIEDKSRNGDMNNALEQVLNCMRQTKKRQLMCESSWPSSIKLQGT